MLSFPVVFLPPAIAVVTPFPGALLSTKAVRNTTTPCHSRPTLVIWKAFCRRSWFLVAGGREATVAGFARRPQHLPAGRALPQGAHHHHRAQTLLCCLRGEHDMHFPAASPPQSQGIRRFAHKVQWIAGMSISFTTSFVHQMTKALWWLHWSSMTTLLASGLGSGDQSRVMLRP